MLQNTTVDKLIAMRLTAMADLFKIQGQDPSMKELSFEDRFGLLVDAEYNRRKDNRLKRLIKQAGFEQPDAAIADIDYHSGRKLDQSYIGGADIFLDHLPINVHYRSSNYES